MIMKHSLRFFATFYMKGVRPTEKSGSFGSPYFLEGLNVSCVAIFVDAGYLFAQGSAAISGSSKPRPHIDLLKNQLILELKNLIHAKCPSTPLLRIYWYDGQLGGGRLSTEQAEIAKTDYVKLRLGFINNQGQQKGVDSLIVTDLIELARNKSISDAILVSGDEDVRIGVVISQSLGVRIHLLGIYPRENNQSQQLIQESDTTAEWSAEVVERFMKIKIPALYTSAAIPSVITLTELNSFLGIDIAIVKFVGLLEVDIKRSTLAFFQQQKGLPSDIDRVLLAKCREAISRDLNFEEKRYMRRKFAEKLNESEIQP